MPEISKRRHGRSYSWTPVILAAVLLAATPTTRAEESDFAGLIRGKLPDRGVYQPPTIAPSVRVAAADDVSWDVDVPSSVRGVNHSEPVAADVWTPSSESQSAPGETEDWPHAEPWPMPTRSFGNAPSPGPYGGCDSLHCRSCDSGGGACSAVGCGSRLRMTGCTERWFGSAELMLMFRKGDTLPILATTSASGNGQGILPIDPNGDTRLLFGGERVLDDMTAGGRVTLGMRLDDAGYSSLVFRGWAAGKEDFRFHRDSNGNFVIARPFFNTDPFSSDPNTGETPFQDSLPIAGLVGGSADTPGSITIDGSNEVYGGDIAIRRLWTAGLGGVVEVLYGYQHMRMRDRLGIASDSLPDSGLLVVEDRFEADNRFHGGQFGLATRYREGCWSFDGLLKVAAGSLRRDANRAGYNQDDGIPDPSGLLVGVSNSDPIRDSTFAWVPELNATLGYRYTERLDLTIGYHWIAMTDALRVSGMIDPDLAVNRSTPLPADPSPELRFSTFHVQGIHFGLQYVY